MGGGGNSSANAMCTSTSSLTARQLRPSRVQQFESVQGVWKKAQRTCTSALIIYTHMALLHQRHHLLLHLSCFFDFFLLSNGT